MDSSSGSRVPAHALRNKTVPHSATLVTRSPPNVSPSPHSFSRTATSPCPIFPRPTAPLWSFHADAPSKSHADSSVGSSTQTQHSHPSRGDTKGLPSTNTCKLRSWRRDMPAHRLVCAEGDSTGDARNTITTPQPCLLVGCLALPAHMLPRHYSALDR